MRRKQSIDQATDEAIKSLPKLSVSRVGEVLWGAIFEAFVVALMILIFGQLGIAMTAGIWKEMTPDLPLVQPGVEASYSPSPTGIVQWREFVAHHQFAIVYGLSYAGLVLFQLARYSSNPKQRRLVRVLRRISRKVSENWFELTFGNAIGALIGAIVLGVVQQFSLVRILVHIVLGWLHPVIYRTAEFFFNASQIATVAGLIHWYDANQLKFAFWVLYISAVLDDLGLPNLKTISRRCWNWFKTRTSKAPSLPENRLAS